MASLVAILSISDWEGILTWLYHHHRSPQARRMIKTILQGRTGTPEGDEVLRVAGEWKQRVGVVFRRRVSPHGRVGTGRT